MTYTTIKIEGPILSADILDKLAQDEVKGQKPADFTLPSGKVKDEIARVWADCRDQWSIFSRRMEREDPKDKLGTSRTRKYWMEHFLDFLEYNINTALAVELQGKSFAISHRAENRDGFPVHITGFNVDLDRKLEKNRGAMSTHAMVQEYLNLSDDYLYALVTNGTTLRLLRDSSRLIRLSFIEFDLKQMMEEEHFADFAVLYRLLHATRMAASSEEPSVCLIEEYHQDSLEEGARIRDGLSKAVEESLRILADGFLSHPANLERLASRPGGLPTGKEFFHHLLFLIYRMLFLMVIEDRRLIFPKEGDPAKRQIYFEYYSISRLRQFCERRRSGEKKHIDLWEGLKKTFRLFDENSGGLPLKIAPLGGALFHSNSLGCLEECNLTNDLLLRAIEKLNWFHDPRTRQVIRVNYGSLNVEEFGSVYEGLLEIEAELKPKGRRYELHFTKGTERSRSGSHYTPEELVKPLIQHSLDYVIAEKLKAENQEKALLSITVCDPACGSGHVILNAARRIAREVARVRTGEEQPSPTAYRSAVRDVIRCCIYGVDKNPLAVELCKVALWLEAHEPGKPLNFLDHHIKHGDSILGIARLEELSKGIPPEAFKKARPGDDKKIMAAIRKRHTKEKKEIESGQAFLELGETIKDQYLNIKAALQLITDKPEENAQMIDEKKAAYENLTNSPSWQKLRKLNDLICAQFFLPKNDETTLTTAKDFHEFMNGTVSMTENPRAKAAAKCAKEKSFFHWYLEFPEVMQAGGFDCMLGNPPFLGGSKISSFYGDQFLDWLLYSFAPAGAIDLVGYFFRQAFNLINQNNFLGFISTNTIAQGGTREGSLEVIIKVGGEINFAIRSTPWPGQAAVSVSLATIYKGEWKKTRVLDGKTVSIISTYLDDMEEIGKPMILLQNQNKSFEGSKVYGDGFLLLPEKAKKIIANNNKNKDILFPYFSGKDINSNPNQTPSRWVINFFDWSVEKAEDYPDCYDVIEKTVKPERQRKKEDGSFVVRIQRALKWWQFAEKSITLYKTIKPLKQILITARVSKTTAFCFVQSSNVYSDATTVFAFERYLYFSILQSTIHSEWSWKNCSTMKGDLRYSPTAAFQTFPFPAGISLEKREGDPLTPMEQELEEIGADYHEFRKQLMLKLQLGLTKTYNQFHNPGLTQLDPALTEKEIKKQHNKGVYELRKHLNKIPGTIPYNQAVQEILTLRQKHKTIDLAVLKAYGWQDIQLNTGFYDVDYLPENDRTRYTINPTARKEILKRLIKLNHTYHQKEVDAGLVDEKGKPVKKKAGRKAKKVEEQGELFS